MRKTRAKSVSARAKGRTERAVKQFGALARVSSREQEREGWSLEIQVDDLQKEADRRHGKIVKLFKIAETATKSEERKTFKELINWAIKNKAEIDGLLFYKVDRAARNLFDYVELERLETDHDIPFVSTSQPTDNMPAGRLARRMLAIIASFYTEQQMLDVRDGQRKRVEAGLFVGMAPYGYQNVRVDGRGLVEVEDNEAKNVRYIFQLYAYEPLTPDMIVNRLAEEGIAFTAATPRWLRCKIYDILRDRSYIGEVFYQGIWHPGVHEPLIDRITFDRVQVLLGDKARRSHELTYAGELIRCGYCGCPVTGEAVTKKDSGKTYVYYRCSRYNVAGHPRDRVPEAKLDAQVLGWLSQMKFPEDLRSWFVRTLHQWFQHAQKEHRDHADALQRELSSLRNQQDRNHNLYNLGEIELDTFSKKNTEYRDRIATCELQLQAVDRRREEHAELAQKVFELSQSLTDRWLSADYAAKRRILEIICLNFRLEGATLVPEMRKPFDVLAKGPSVFSSRGDKI